MIRAGWRGSGSRCRLLFRPGEKATHRLVDRQEELFGLWHFLPPGFDLSCCAGVCLPSWITKKGRRSQEGKPQAQAKANHRAAQGHRGRGEQRHGEGKKGQKTGSAKKKISPSRPNEPLTHSIRASYNLSNSAKKQVFVRAVPGLILYERASRWSYTERFLCAVVH